MVISKGVKSEILDRLADIISKITAYPNKDNYESVAKVLVAKHPCLREPGSGKGWYCWVFSLRFKMGNYRRRMMAAGCSEVLVNKRKRGEEKCKPSRSQKKERSTTCQSHLRDRLLLNQRRIVRPCFWKCRRRTQIYSFWTNWCLQHSHSGERRSLVMSHSSLQSWKDGRHCLLKDSYVPGLAESSPKTCLIHSLRAIVPSLLEAYKAAVASRRRITLSGVMQCLQREDTNQNRRMAALLGLPKFLSGDSSNIIRMCDAHGPLMWP